MGKPTHLGGAPAPGAPPPPAYATEIVTVRAIVSATVSCIHVSVAHRHNAR